MGTCPKNEEQHECNVHDCGNGQSDTNRLGGVRPSLQVALVQRLFLFQVRFGNQAKLGNSCFSNACHHLQGLAIRNGAVGA